MVVDVLNIRPPRSALLQGHTSGAFHRARFTALRIEVSQRGPWRSQVDDFAWNAPAHGRGVLEVESAGSGELRGRHHMEVDGTK